MLRGGWYVRSWANAILLTNNIVASNTSGAGNADSVTLAGIKLAAAQSILDANAGATLNLNADIDTGAFLNMTFDGSGNVVINGIISGSGSIVKNGEGTLSLTGANTYNGSTTINQGVLLIASNTALGNSAGTTVNNGAALEAQGNITVNVPLALNGAGIGEGVDVNGNGGALRVVSNGASPSHVTWTGGISLASGTDFIGVDQGNFLNITGVVVIQINGSLRPCKVGAGTLEFQRQHDQRAIQATTTVLGGLLQLDKTNGAVAIPGNLVIGDQRNPIATDPTTGSAAYNGNFTATTSGAIVQLLGNNQIAPVDVFAVNLLSTTIYPSGMLDLNGFNDTLGNITLYQGAAFSAQISTASDVPATTGTLSLEGGSISLLTSEGSSSASPPATIAGRLDLSTLFSGGAVGNGQGQYHFINVATTQLPGFENPNLAISASISGTAADGLEKANAAICNSRAQYLRQPHRGCRQAW